MASIAKLKDRARKHEQKEDWQAAIQAYQQVLEKEAGADEIELELGLYNRIGDLYLRLGQTDEAVSYYETAADMYADSGFTNNAIALCNKALRHRPNRPEIYLKLSRLCNEQGFQIDARRWILEFAERQMKAGRVEEALTGLDDFAALSDDPEIRATLAQQLAAHNRPDEAVDQLRHAYRLYSQRGEADAASEVAERARAIDPSVDLAAEAPAAEPAPEPAASAETAADEPAAGVAGLEGLETRREELSGGEAAGVEGLEPTVAGDDAVEEAEAPSGLERAEEAPAAPPEEVEAGGVGGLETFDEAGAEEEPEPLPLLDSGYEEEPGEEAEALPLLDSDSDQAVDEVEEAGEVEAEVEPAEEPVAEAEAVEEEVAAAEAVEAEPVEEPVAEAEVVEEPVVEEPVVEEPVVEEEAVEAEAVEESEVEEPLDLSFAGGSTSMGAEESARPELDEEHAAEAMDLDLGSFDLGVTSGGAPSTPPEDVDVEAVLQRGRELVSRGLTGEALRELRLLSGAEEDPEMFRHALAIVNEIIRHDANDINALQRRVEYAARLPDRELLKDAYTELGDALARLGAETKAQAMYERVLALDPGSDAAREALGGADEAEEDAVDLDAVLREVGPEELAAGKANAGVESDASFAAMLSQFKAKVTDKVESEEAGDHYDLGLAFKEMGLIDEAIAEFQTALTGGTERLKVYEELGQCFMQKNQYTVALKVLNRALKVPHKDSSELLGVYYHLGQCHEELGQRAEAREAYEQVLAIDDSFADVPDRVARL